MTVRTLTWLLVLTLTATLTVAQEADQPAAPAEKPQDNKQVEAPEAKPAPAADIQDLKATVTGVRGIVQARGGEDQPWNFVKPGQVFDMGTEIRTGPRSAVQLAIPPDQTLTLDRLGTITLLQAVAERGKIITDVGMRYGRTKLQVETGGVEHESTIHSPAATLAVRGSEVTVQHDGMTSFAYGEGHLEYINRYQRQAMAFGGDGVKSRVTPERMSPPVNARASATVDGKGDFAGRTLAESLRVEEMAGVGGEDLRDLMFRRQGLAGFSSSSFSAAPENTLIFDLFFFGGLDGITSVDLIVTDPNGQTLSPAMLATSDGRGFHSGDSIQAGGMGQETVTYGGTFNNVALPFLNGTYNITAQLDPVTPGGLTVFYVVQPIQTVDGGPALPTPLDTPVNGFLDNAFAPSESTTYTAPK